MNLHFLKTIRALYFPEWDLHKNWDSQEKKVAFFDTIIISDGAKQNTECLQTQKTIHMHYAEQKKEPDACLHNFMCAFVDTMTDQLMYTFRDYMSFSSEFAFRG